MTADGTGRQLLRVLFYSHSGDVSGAEISLLLTIQHLKMTHTTLAAPEGDLLNRAQTEGIETVTVRSHRARMSNNPVHTLRGVVGTLIAGFQLRRVVRQNRPDIVHANSIRAGLIALVGTFGTKVPLAWHVRDHLPHNVIGRSIRWLAERYIAAVFVISDAIAQNFSSTPSLRDKTKVIYNGIPLGMPAPGGRLRDELKTNSDCFVVGVVGQITPWKRQADALSAFTRFCQRMPHSELWIVGSPKFRRENETYFESLKRTAKKSGMEEHIRFLGHRDDIPEVMQAIDVLLVPSENEPFGRVVIEAMLAGKPVIGTRGGGIPEIIRDGETGFLVDIGDTRTMDQLLQWISCSDNLRRRLGESGRLRCLDQFSIETTCAQIEDAYAMITGSPTRREWLVAATEARVGGQ